MKLNKAKLRRDIATKLLKVFDDSGIEYTCGASVFGAVRSEAINEAKSLVAQGINLSKSNYAFAWVGNMADMFASDVWKLVHNRKYPNNGNSKIS